MADFSFSFDSDNPFAEPEQTPKKASAPTDETPAPAANTSDDRPVSPAAPVAVPSAFAGDEFALDSFDFAFDEGASVNDSLPTQLNPPDESPRNPTPGEAAFAEFDFGSFKGQENTIEAEASETSAKFEEPETFAEVEAIDISAETETPEALTESEATEMFAGAETETPAAFTTLESSEMFAHPETLEAPAEPTELAEPEVTETLDGNESLETFVAPESPAIFLGPDAPEETQPQTFSPLDKIKSIATSRKSSTKSAPSDLEEFNSLTFDLGTPADEMFDGDSEAETEVAPFAEEAETEAEMSPLAEEVEAMPLAEAPLFDEPIVSEMPAEPIREESVPVAVPVAVAAVETLTDLNQSEARAEAEFRRLKTQRTLSVAILGASGIGKNHARWFHRHGCRIAGFLGTTNDSVTQTEANLSAEFDFQGNAYTDLEELLKNEKPDIVCVATPPPLHFAHVLQSLEAGAHVLCEKPLVYAPTRKFRENRDGAKELVKVAAKKNLNLGTQLQYGAATPILCKLAGLSPTDVGDFAMELETLNPNSPRDPRELWIDLGPHPVSVAQMLAGPGSQLAEETIRFEPYDDGEKTEVLARFGINCADGRLLMVRAVVRALRGDDAPAPRRRFSFNGHSVTYAPLQSAKNGFQAQFIAPDGYASVYPDPVDYLIGNFVNSCRNAEPPMISGDFGRENLEWMLKVSTPGEVR